MFSKSCEYGLQAVLYIALHSNNIRNVSLKEIAEAQKIPLHFLSKILQILVKHKVVISTKGPHGGFFLYKRADKLKLIEIVKAIDGLDMLDRCGIGMKQCSDDHPCPIHDDFKIVKAKIKSLLSEKTLADLSKDIEDGKSFVTYKN